MQIYIAADMEGVAGIAMQEQLTKGTAEYAEARHLLTLEVNAAVAGALEGGATRVVVKDAHGTGFNLVPELLDPRAEYVIGPSQPDRFPGLNEDFAGLFLVGYHAMAGTEGAVCDHTMSTQAWSRYVLCGREVGEVGIDAAIAGIHGVPVLLVTGDDKVCREARELLGPGVGTCQTKVGLGRHSAISLAPKAAREKVQAAAREAMGRVGQVEPFRPSPPYRVDLTYALSSMADGRYCDGVHTIRLDGRTVRYQGDDLYDVIQRSLR